MENNSEFPEKLDALDLIINALKHHEKKLDELSERLENIFESLSTDEIKVPKEDEKQIELQRTGKRPYITLKKWGEFKHICRSAKIVAFDIENNLFNVYSRTDEDVLKYSEELPNNVLRVVEDDSYFSIDKFSLNNKIDLLQSLFEGMLKCGLSFSIKSSRTALPEKGFLFKLTYNFTNNIKGFLSQELNISKGNIIQGKITY